MNAQRAETNPGLADFVDYYLDEGITTLIGSGRRPGAHSCH